MLPTIDATMASLRARILPQSTSTPGVRKPNSSPRRAVWMAFADPTRVLVGIHPTVTQVPPTFPRSITATRAPRAAARVATFTPPIPAPTTARS